VGAAEMDGEVRPEHDLAGVEPDRKTDIEIARLIGRVLSLAARRLGVPQGDNLRLLCDGLLAAARDGRLDPLEYRLAYWLRFGGPFGPPGQRR
jgi:hypothetical protein